jgi:hypothetical protein
VATKYFRQNFRCGLPQQARRKLAGKALRIITHGSDKNGPKLGFTP